MIYRPDDVTIIEDQAGLVIGYKVEDRFERARQAWERFKADPTPPNADELTALFAAAER